MIPLNLTEKEIQEGIPGGTLRPRKGKAGLELLVGRGMKEINELKEACEIERSGSPRLVQNNGNLSNNMKEVSVNLADCFFINV